MHNGSVFIAKIKFKRDSNPNIKPRQFIVINKDNRFLYFLETESVVNKVKFNISNIKRAKLRYHILSNAESKNCGFSIPTAINCAELFYCDYFPEINRLKNRDLPVDIFNEIQEKRKIVKNNNLHRDDCKIKRKELLQFNPKLI